MFYGFVITEAGNRLLAKMVAGETLELTRVVMERGTAESAEAARRLTAPIDPGPDGTSTAPVLDGSAVNMIAEYRSDLGGGLQEGFWIGGFAIYAKDPDGGDDVMIYYGSLGDAKQYVSAYTPGTAPDVRRYPVSVTVTAGVEVTASYPVEAWMTARDVADCFNGTLKPDLEASLAGLIAAHDGDENAHGDLRWLIVDSKKEAQETANAALEAANDAASTASAAASAASAAQETAERALELAGEAGGEAVGAHNTADDAHPALHVAISGLESRLATLELKYFYDVTGNSFEVSFIDLTGLEVSGVWNKELARIEF